MRIILCLALFLLCISPSMASMQIGKISSITFHGSGISEVISVKIDPEISDCAYKGSFIMYTNDRPAITSALIAAFHSQTTVRIHGTGRCHKNWTNHEELDYAEFHR
ncbi:hypothetical protein AB4407_15670 [Vibrio sp. 10N.261.46.E11]|uniref:hypothetical protein n=1 Tax=Vibrio sp. 10N.261.46.E11 TaxID=3229662 RepID=UPI00355293F8